MRKSPLSSDAVRVMCLGRFCLATTLWSSAFGGLFGPMPPPVASGFEGDAGATSVFARRAKTRYCGEPYPAELLRYAGSFPLTSGARENVFDSRTLPLFAP